MFPPIKGAVPSATSLGGGMMSPLAAQSRAPPISEADEEAALLSKLHRLESKLTTPRKPVHADLSSTIKTAAPVADTSSYSDELSQLKNRSKAHESRIRERQQKLEAEWAARQAQLAEEERRRTEQVMKSEAEKKRAAEKDADRQERSRVRDQQRALRAQADQQQILEHVERERHRVETERFLRELDRQKQAEIEAAHARIEAAKKKAVEEEAQRIVDVAKEQERQRRKDAAFRKEQDDAVTREREKEEEELRQLERKYQQQLTFTPSKPAVAPAAASIRRPVLQPQSPRPIPSREYPSVLANIPTVAGVPLRPNLNPTPNGAAAAPGAAGSKPANVPASTQPASAPAVSLELSTRAMKLLFQVTSSDSSRDWRGIGTLSQALKPTGLDLLEHAARAIPHEFGGVRLLRPEMPHNGLVMLRKVVETSPGEDFSGIDMLFGKPRPQPSGLGLLLQCAEANTSQEYEGIALLQQPRTEQKSGLSIIWDLMNPDVCRGLALLKEAKDEKPEDASPSGLALICLVAAEDLHIMPRGLELLQSARNTSSKSAHGHGDSHPSGLLALCHAADTDPSGALFKGIHLLRETKEASTPGLAALLQSTENSATLTGLQALQASVRKPLERLPKGGLDLLLLSNGGVSTSPGLRLLTLSRLNSNTSPRAAMRGLNALYGALEGPAKGIRALQLSASGDSKRSGTGLGALIASATQHSPGLQALRNSSNSTSDTAKPGLSSLLASATQHSPGLVALQRSTYRIPESPNPGAGIDALVAVSASARGIQLLDQALSQVSPRKVAPATTAKGGLGSLMSAFGSDNCYGLSALHMALRPTASPNRGLRNLWFAAPDFCPGLTTLQISAHP